MVLNRQRRLRVSVVPLMSFLDCVRRALGFPEDSVTVRLVSDASMARLNREFRGKDGPTDVLSFPANGNKPQKVSRSVISYGNKRALTGIYIGDIAIAPAIARCSARLYARTFTQELRILILHGMIHLAGYDHESDEGQMVRLERKMRRQFGLTDRRFMKIR